LSVSGVSVVAAATDRALWFDDRGVEAGQRRPDIGVAGAAELELWFVVGGWSGLPDVGVVADEEEREVPVPDW
jgi:hypothetical protein